MGISLFAHAALDWDNEPDALKGEDSCADEQCPRGWVEVLDIGNSRTGDNGSNVVVVKIYQTKEDEDVGDQGHFLDVVDVAVEAYWQEYDHLDKNEPFDSDVGLTSRHSKDESL